MIGAVDIGGTKIAVGLVDDAGRVLSRADCPTDPGSGYAAALERTQQMLRALSDRLISVAQKSRSDWWMTRAACCRVRIARLIQEVATRQPLSGLNKCSAPCLRPLASR